MIFFYCRNFIKMTLMTSTIWLAFNGLEIVLNQSFNVTLIRMSAIAQAQEFSEQQLESYAQAILAIEPLRQKTFRELQRILDSEKIPMIACDRAESYENLNPQARSLIINYCNESKAIVEEKGLTVSEFNNITSEVKSNPDLKQQVQQEMLELE